MNEAERTTLCKGSLNQYKGGNYMFDKFGEFDSSEEINKAVAAQLNEGDEAAVIDIAKENGIDKEDAEDYIDGCTEDLVTPLMAAVGKLNVEASDLELKGIVVDWKDSISEMCMEDMRMCIAVRRKGKRLAECMAKLIRFAFENKVQISNKIVDITKVTVNGKEEKMRSPLYLGIPNKTEVKKIVREYYLS